MTRALLTLTMTVLIFLPLGLADDVLACSVCYGDPQAPMSKGLRAGVLFLLSIVMAVLAGFAFFFLSLRRRAKLGEM